MTNSDLSPSRPHFRSNFFIFSFFARLFVCIFRDRFALGDKNGTLYFRKITNLGFVIIYFNNVEVQYCIHAIKNEDSI